MGSKAGSIALSILKALTKFLLLLLAAIVLAYGVLAMLSFLISPPRGDRRRAEVKYNLHNIQLAVERYAVDHDGAYPPYLIGGAPKYAAHFDELGGATAFDDPQPCADIAQVADPLLREGYLDEYPRNPFVRTSPKPFTVHKAQLHDPYWPPGGDPLRNGTAEAQRLGTRFGADCRTMGQVLGDPRYQLAGGLPGSPVSAEACAGVMYPYWDIWAMTKPKPFLPGEFFYRGTGPVIYPPSAAGAATAVPGGMAPGMFETDSYILGVYGGWRDKGQDVLGSFGNPYWIPGDDPSQVQDLPPMQGGQGIPDAVIMTLSSGSDTQ